MPWRPLKKADGVKTNHRFEKPDSPIAYRANLIQYYMNVDQSLFPYIQSAHSVSTLRSA